MTTYRIVPDDPKGFSVRVTHTNREWYFENGFPTRAEAEAWIAGRQADDAKRAADDK